MHIDRYGTPEKPVLLLLHGAGTTDTFANQYQALSQQYHVWVPHLYGSGKAVDQLYEKRKTIDALLSIIDGVDQSQINVAGCSLGAGLALALACERPDRVRKAMLFSPWVCPQEKTARLYGTIAAKTAWMTRWRWMVRLQGKYWHMTDAQADFMAEYSQHITPENLKAWFCDGVKLQDYPGYDQLGVPILAICGSREVGQMLSSLRELGRRNPHCSVQIWKNAGHDMPMRNIQRVNRAMLEFFK